MPNSKLCVMKFDEVVKTFLKIYSSFYLLLLNSKSALVKRTIDQDPSWLLPNLGWFMHRRFEKRREAPVKEDWKGIMWSICKDLLHYMLINSPWEISCYNLAILGYYTYKQIDCAGWQPRRSP